MIETLLRRQKEHLEYFYEHIDQTSLQIVFDRISACRGVLFLTGVGKSGFVAQKVAATMMSTGTKAFFLPPLDALHGDLGMVNREDIVIIFSKSGQTEELLHLLPFIRSKGALLISITSHEQSRLAKSCEYHIHLPCEKELCPFDLAPTTSTEIQLLIGDLLAIYLMEKKQFSLDQYRQNHPGGSIGRRATVHVKDLMKERCDTPLCIADACLEEVLRDFTDKRCGCLIVVDENKRLQGIFTDGDLRRALQKKGEKVLKESLGSLMTREARYISSEAPAIEAMKLMESDHKHPIMVLPVVENEEVVGIIKMHDIIQSGI
jgi:arabinose-5-phosphate isomerase